ncbi:COMPASS (complex proteins associated with Set1p) component [Malassezia sp. CBS 17886]|nr:COMPASS (complex proteins associated with Set1p) component [Malassezia sp. CBS 17886]
MADAAAGGVLKRRGDDPVHESKRGGAREAAPDRGAPAVHEDATKLFCICQRPYDEERLMIACDRCDQWLHAACVGIADDAVDMLEWFTCGMHAVLARMERIDVGRTPAQRMRLRTAAVDAAHNRRGIAVWAHPALAAGACGESDAAWFVRMRHGTCVARDAPLTAPPPGVSVGQFARAHAADADWTPEDRAVLAQELATLVHASATVTSSIDLLSARSKLLQLAEDRLSVHPAAAACDAGQDGPVCGFDARLCWTDEAFSRWAQVPATRAMLQEELPLDGTLTTSGGADAVVCGLPKRRCKRHADWSIVRGADLEVNRDMQTAYLSTLAECEQDARESLARLHARPA